MMRKSGFWASRVGRTRGTCRERAGHWLARVAQGAVCVLPMACIMTQHVVTILSKHKRHRAASEAAEAEEAAEAPRQDLVQGLEFVGLAQSDHVASRRLRVLQVRTDLLVQGGRAGAQRQRHETRAVKPGREHLHVPLLRPVAVGRVRVVVEASLKGVEKRQVGFGLMLRHKEHGLRDLVRCVRVRIAAPHKGAKDPEATGHVRFFWYTKSAHYQKMEGTWNGKRCRYVGEWHQGLPHGDGRLYDHEDVLRYEGQFCRGARHGRGTFRWNSGAVYEGEWKNDMRHGKGTYCYDNGIVYAGTWERNKRHGPGSCTHGTTRLDVTFANDEITHVKEFFLERLRYAGGWHASGGRHGHGVLYFHDGVKVSYDGEWKHGKEHGWGTAYRETGSVRFRGMWTDGRPDREATKRQRTEAVCTRKRQRVRQRIADLHASADGAVAPVPTCVLCLEEIHHGDPSYVYVPCGHRALCGTCGKAPPDPWHRQCPVCKQDSTALCRVY